MPTVPPPQSFRPFRLSNDKDTQKRHKAHKEVTLLFQTPIGRPLLLVRDITVPQTGMLLARF